MTLRFGEVVLIRMQFHQTTGIKIRPAVVLLDTGDDDFVAAPITSQLRHTDYDLFLEDWRAAGLNVASCVRVHKLSVLPKADIVRSLARVSTQDADALRNHLLRAFSPGTLGA